MWETVVQDFLLYCEAKGLATLTLKTYRRALRSFTNWLSRCPSQEVTAGVLREYVRALAQKHEPGGARTLLRPLWACLRWATDEGYFSSDPTRRVPLPKLPQKLGATISDPEFEKLITAALGSNRPLRNAAILSVLMDCGLRPSEVGGLRLDDLLPGGYLAVRRGKGGKARVVPVSRLTVRRIRAYIQAERPKTPLPHLFIGGRGGADLRPLTAQALNAVLRRLSLMAGTRVIGPYNFRRASATVLWRGSRDLLAVSRFLGHADPKVTMRYLAIDPGDLKATHTLHGPFAER